MGKGKVLIIDKVHQCMMEGLDEMNFEVDYNPTIERNEILDIIPNYIGIVIRSKTKIDKDLIERGNKLKFIARVGSGMENIDVNFATERNIFCLNSPEGNRDAVGEHSLAMILALFNKIIQGNAEVKAGRWDREKHRGIELKGKIIGIIGYGNTGSSFAKKLRGFEVKVYAYDKYKFNYTDLTTVEESNMDTLFARCDILSLHVPLTSETKYLVNDKFINKFEKNIYLINTSRGEIVNTNDLVKNLKSGKVLGAVLDVLEYEDLTFEAIKNKNNTTAYEYLKQSDNVILTPHVAGWTEESNYKLSKILVEKIKNISI